MPRDAYREAGALRGSATALAGYPGMFHRLRAEHGALSRMLGSMLQLEQGLARGAPLTCLHARLLIHLRGESHAFYPYLSRFQELRPLVARCIAGHRAIDAAIHAVAASADGPRQQWNACLQRLATVLPEHIACEEHEVFPLANELLSRRRAQQMLNRYQSDRDPRRERG